MKNNLKKFLFRPVREVGFWTSFLVSVLIVAVVVSSGIGFVFYKSSQPIPKLIKAEGPTVPDFLGGRLSALDVPNLEARLGGMEAALRRAEVEITQDLWELESLRSAPEGTPGYNRYTALKEKIFGHSDYISRRGRNIMMDMPGTRDQIKMMKDKIKQLKDVIQYLKRGGTKVGALSRLWRWCSSKAGTGWRIAGRVVAPISLFFEGVIGYFNFVEIFAEQEDWELTAKIFVSIIKADNSVLNKIKSYCENNEECVDSLIERISKALSSRYFIQLRDYNNGNGNSPVLQEIFNEFKNKFLRPQPTLTNSPFP
ncbi:MAG: hypothetical protein ABH822_02220 [Patescibacteria group bacterium]